MLWLQDRRKARLEIKASSLLAASQGARRCYVNCWGEPLAAALLSLSRGVHHSLARQEVPGVTVVSLLGGNQKLADWLQ